MENLNLEIEVMMNGALQQMKEREHQPVILKIDLKIAVGLISQLQLAFRHPANTGPNREMLEKFARDLIELLDPERAELYRLLMMGFDERFDQPAKADFPEQDFIKCQNCERVVGISDGRCSVCGEKICLICGCTDSAGCEEGCYRARENVCSACAFL